MHLHVISVASVCVYDQSHTLDDNIAFDLQPLYFQFDGRSSCTQLSTAITSVYINGGGGTPSLRFSGSIHTGAYKHFRQILLSELCCVLTFKALARQECY